MPALILPPLRRTAADAALFAKIVHEGQTDKAGRPYVEHPRRVQREAALEMVKYAGFDFESQEVDEARQIALLHDVLEPDARPFGPISIADLRAEGFAETVISGVETLTRIDGVSRGGQRVTYDEWIRWICHTADLAVILVKLADVEDNADPERIALLPEPEQTSLPKRYARAREALQAAARAKGWQG